MRSFRQHHLLLLLASYSSNRLPLDHTIATYFRQHKALGSKDRAYIAETAYTLIRNMALLDACCTAPYTWEKRLEQLPTLSTVPIDHLPRHTQLNTPESLYNRLSSDWGLALAETICSTNQTQAPITIRANLIKTTRDALICRLSDRYEVTPCPKSATGIHFNQRFPLFSLPEFKEGLFEMQDEASQLIAALVQTTPGDHVLDFCAGSGGKSLAIAPLMHHKGQLYLHDVRNHVLVEAKRRLSRAGVTNAQTLPLLKNLKKKCDWVLVDAPCSGTGTFRRNPDMKWGFHTEGLSSLIGQQRSIFEQALSHLKPDGKIVYATCSILKDENQNQVDHFLKTYSLRLMDTPLQTFPEEGGMDGFYGAVLVHKSKPSSAR